MLKSKDTEAKGPAIYFFPTGEMFRLIKTPPLLPFLSFPPSLLPCVREHDNLLFVIYLAACRYTSRNRREIVTLTDSLLSFVAPTKKKSIQFRGFPLHDIPFSLVEIIIYLILEYRLKKIFNQKYQMQRDITGYQIIPSSM